MIFFENIMNYFFVWAVIQKSVSLQFSVQKNQQFAEKQTKKEKTNLKKKERKKQKKESAWVKEKPEKIRIRDLRKDSLDVCNFVFRAKKKPIWPPWPSRPWPWRCKSQPEGLFGHTSPNFFAAPQWSKKVTISLSNVAKKRH